MVVRDGRGWVIKPDHELKQSKAKQSNYCSNDVANVNDVSDHHGI